MQNKKSKIAGMDKAEAAKQFILAWHESSSLKEVQERLGISKQSIYNRRDILQRKGVVFKKMRGSQIDYESLVAYSKSLNK